MFKFRSLSIFVLFLCLAVPLKAFAQDEGEELPKQDLQVINDLVVGDVEEDGVSYYIPKIIKANLEEGRQVHLGQYMDKKKDFYLVFKYIDGVGPKVEFKYRLDEHDVKFVELSAYSYTDNTHYIKKVYDPKSGKIVRIVTKDIDTETGFPFETILREEAGKDKTTNVIMETRGDGAPFKKIVQERSKMSSLFPQENIEIKVMDSRRFYVINNELFSFVLKPNRSSKAIGFSMDFMSTREDVKLYVDYKTEPVDDVSYPTIKFVSVTRTDHAEMVSKSIYEYNSRLNNYELSNIQVKDALLDKHDPTISEKFKTGVLNYQSVDRSNIITLLVNYLSEHKALGEDMSLEAMLEAFNLYVVEKKDCVLGIDEQKVLFGIDGSGGLYDYFKMNLGIPYYYNLAILYGALSNSNGLVKERYVSKSVSSAFDDMGLVSVASVTSKFRPEEIEKITGIQFNERSLIRFSDGLIDYGRGLIKK